MSQYKLYYSKYCYFCQKVMFHLRGQKHEIEFMDVANSKNQSALINGGGKGQVPCLLIEDGSKNQQWLYESDDIIQYINKNHLIKTT